MTVVSQVMTEISRAQSPAVAAPTNVQLARNAQPPEQAAATTTAVSSSEGLLQTAGSSDVDDSALQGSLFVNGDSGASPRAYSVACEPADLNSAARLRLASDDSGVDCDDVTCVGDLSSHSWGEEPDGRQPFSNQCAGVGDISYDRRLAAMRRRASPVEEGSEEDLCSEAKRHCSARGVCENAQQKRDSRSGSSSTFVRTPIARGVRAHQEADIARLGAEAGYSSTGDSYNNAANTRAAERTARSCDRRDQHIFNSFPEPQSLHQSEHVPSKSRT